MNLPNIDIRSTGGYIVAPGTSAPAPDEQCMEASVCWTWALGKSPDEVEIAKCPAWVFEFAGRDATAPRVSEKVVCEATKSTQPNALSTSEERCRSALVQPARGLLDFPATPVAEGQRHNWVFKSLCSMRGRNVLQDDARRFIVSVVDNPAFMEPGFGVDEAERQVDDVYTRFEAGQTPTAQGKTALIPVPRLRALTDTGNAHRFHDRLGWMVRWTTDAQTWFLWDGRRWHAQGACEALVALMMEVASAIQDEVDLVGPSDESEEELKRVAKSQDEIRKWGRASQSRRNIDNSLSLLRSLPGIAVTMEAFDSQEHLLNTQNCIVNLDTGEISPHDPALLMTRMTAVGYYRPLQEHVASWDWFMTTVTGGDAESVAYLQQVAGSTCWGRALTNLFVIHGPSGTGKTTFVSALASVLGLGRGGYAETTQYRYWTKQGADSLTAQDHLASLAGSRFVVCNEADTRALDMTLLKSVIDGGSQVTAGRKHKGTFSFAPRFTFVLTTNEAPRFNGGDSDGSKRRLRMVEFKHQFIHADAMEVGDDDWRVRYADPNGCGLAILFWAVQGAIALYKKGFRLDAPAAVHRSTSAYHHSNDPFGVWFEEQVVRDDNGLLFTKDVLLQFQKWCAESGIPVISDSDISSRLPELARRANPTAQKKQKRPAAGLNGAMCHTGLRLRTAQEVLDEPDEVAVSGIPLPNGEPFIPPPPTVARAGAG